MTDDEDEEAVRAYVSVLWAEDWDNPEEADYDHEPAGQCHDPAPHGRHEWYTPALRRECPGARFEGSDSLSDPPK